MNENAIFLKSKQVWEDNLKLFPHSKLHYPDENLVRLFSGKYVPIPQPPANILDHGFGHGNNLVFFASKGYNCFGCEISSTLISEVQKMFDIIQKPVELRQVHDLTIPFDNECFDIIVSWSVLHYNGSRSAVSTVVEELYRVLKKGGVLLLSTIHPDSSVFDRMISVSGGTYLIEKESEFDNRKGLKFYVAGSNEELATLFQSFSSVKTGYAYFNLFNHSERNAWYLVYATK